MSSAAHTPIRAARATRAADRQVRPLRVLPADLPQLPAARPGNGLAARPHLHDEGRRRRPRWRSAPAWSAHFDTCLGCMACETACPSGVRYAPLIEETRAAIEHHHQRPLGERLFRRPAVPAAAVSRAAARVRAAPRLRQPAAPAGPGCWRCCRAGCSNLIALAPDATLRRRGEACPERTPAVGRDRLRVGLRDRLRPARLLRPRQRRHRPRAGRRRLRSAGAGRPGLLRRAGAALGTRRGGARVRARPDSHVRTRERGRRSSSTRPAADRR